MNLLIAAATEAELAPLLRHLEPYRVGDGGKSYKKRAAGIRVCITGIGSAVAAYHIAKSLASPPDLAVQAGIAGAFSPSMAHGSLWRIRSDRFADLGAEDGERFTDLFGLGFLGEDDFPWQGKILPAAVPVLPLLRDLPETDGITVNTVSGRERTVTSRRERYGAGVESMEGAAFHYVCLMEKVNFAQIRSISNDVEVRDKSKWHIPLAVQKLNELLIRLTDMI